MTVQMRRVLTFDGGNHLTKDLVQYREAAGEPWRDMPVMTAYDAFICDVREGLKSIPADASPELADKIRQDVANKIRAEQSGNGNG